LDGATYPGADGAGAGLLWQQEVAAHVPAATAANAAIFTSFMMVIGGWFLSVLPAIPKECWEPNDREGPRKENRGLSGGRIRLPAGGKFLDSRPRAAARPHDP